MGKKFFRGLRQIGDGDFWQLFFDDGPFHGVVVDEDHRVKSNVEDLLDVADVGGFVLPIGHKDRDVLLAQDHLGMTPKRFSRHRFRVFAADGQNDASTAQFPGPELNLPLDLPQAVSADGDAFHTVVSDDAPPQGVIQVQDAAFLDFACG